MVKIDFGEVLKAAKTPKPVLMTLAINWLVKPFTMYAFAFLFLGILFKGFLEGTETIRGGEEVELWRSYISGAILLGIAPCTAMVLVWSYLARGNDGLTLVMVAINSLTMLVLYAPLGGFLLGVNSMPIPWETILLSVSIYVALPLAAGYVSRKLIIRYKGLEWFEQRFMHYLTPASITALLATLVLLFSFKGDVIVNNPLTIFWISIPLFIQTIFIFSLTGLLSDLKDRLVPSRHANGDDMGRRSIKEGIIRKIIGTFRSENGSQYYQYVASLLSTWRLQGKNMFDELDTVIRKNFCLA